MHASDAINMLVKVSETPDMQSPFQKLYRRAPFSCLLPFLELGLHNVKRTLESELKAQACFFLGSGSSHPRNCCKALLMSGRKSYTRDVICEHPGEASFGIVSPKWGGDPPSPPPLLSEALKLPEDERV